MTGRSARTIAAAIPVVLVNSVAFSGQLAFLREHLPWPLAGQIMMAVALESVAVYLAFHAHLASLAQDSALRLKLASYGFALVIAALNYSHYSGPGWRPTFAAVAVALMSASSPWLWGVHSRRASRDQMIAAGLIEGRAVRLGATRWLWHPVRSTRVMWHATWAGITDPRQAIGEWESARSGNRSASAAGAVAQTAARTGSQTGPETGPVAVGQTGLTAISRPMRPALPGPVSGDAAEPVSGDARGPVRRSRPNRSGKRGANRSRGATAEDAETEFAAEIAAGTVPTLYQIRTRLHVGNERAKAIRQQIARQALST